MAIGCYWIAIYPNESLNMISDWLERINVCSGNYSFSIMLKFAHGLVVRAVELQAEVAETITIKSLMTSSSDIHFYLKLSFETIIHFQSC